MQDFLYHNGDLVVEQHGEMLVTRERGRYTCAPIKYPEATRNLEFEAQVEEWLYPYREMEQYPHLDGDIIPFSEDPFA